MIIEALKEIGGKEGCSLQAIRKWISNFNPDAANKQKASFNTLTKKAILKLEAEDVVMRNKSSFKFSPAYIYREKQRLLDEKRRLQQLAKEQARAAAAKETQKQLAKAMASYNAGAMTYGGGGGGSSSRRKASSVGGSASAVRRLSPEEALLQERNKEVRREWEVALDRRNAYLTEHRGYLEPFLPDERNFFARLREQEEARKAELARQREEDRRRQIEEALREKEAAHVQRVEADRLKAFKAAAAPFQEEYKQAKARLLAQPQQQPAAMAHPQQQPRQQQAAAAPAATAPDYYQFQQQQQQRQQQYQQYYAQQQQQRQMVAAAATAAAAAAGGMYGQAAMAAVPAKPAAPSPPMQASRPIPTPSPTGAESLASGGGGSAGGALLDTHGLHREGGSGSEVKEVMVRMGFISPQDLASGAPLAVTGKPLEGEGAGQPPVEVGPDGRLTMGDAALIGQTIESGPYVGHKVIWPGSRVQLDALPKDSEKELLSRYVGWQQLYWLEKPGVRPEAEGGKREPNVLALRLADGRWVPHRYSLMRVTHRYAEAKRTPLDNRAVIQYRDPVTGAPAVCARDYCWSNRHQEVVRRCLRTRVEKDAALLQRLQDMIDEYLPAAERPIRAWHQQGHQQGLASLASRPPSASPPSMAPSPTPAAAAAANGFHYPQPHFGGLALAGAAPPARPYAPAPTPAPAPAGPTAYPQPTRQGQGQHQQQHPQQAAAPGYYGYGGMPYPGYGYPYPYYPHPGMQQQGQGQQPGRPSPQPGFAPAPYASPYGYYPPMPPHPMVQPPQQPALAPPKPPAVPARAPVPAAPAKPEMDPALKERHRWIGLVGKRVQGASLGELRNSYQFLLEEGRGQPAVLLAPIEAAVAAAAAAEAELDAERRAVDEAEEQKEKEKERADAAAAEAAEAAAAGEQEEGEDGAVEGEAAAVAKPKAEAEEGGEAEEEGGTAEAKSEAASASAPAEAEADGSDSEAEKARQVVVMPPLSQLEGVTQVQASRTILPKLHDHQVEGLSWLVHMYKHGLPAILGDQMGLGKTLQTIAFLAYLKDVLGVAGPHLVVVPLSVLPNWMSEIERFCPSMRCIRFHGPKPERQRIKAEELGDVREFDLVVTTYEMLCSEVNFFKRRFFWRVVVVDEGHRLKNEKSQLSENLRKVRVWMGRCVCLVQCMYLPRHPSTHPPTHGSHPPTKPTNPHPHTPKQTFNPPKPNRCPPTTASS